MKTKAMTDGAMLSALAVIFSLLSYYVPFLMIFYFFIPVPAAIAANKHGMKVAVIAGIAATLILIFFMDLVSALSCGMYLLITGCVVGWAYRSKKSGFVRLALSYVASLLTLTLSLALLQLITGQNFITEFSAAVDQSMAEIQTMYQSLAADPSTQQLLSAEQLESATTLVDTLGRVIKMMIPASFLLAPFIIGWINVIITDKMMVRLKLPVDRLKPLSQWRMPRSLAFFMLCVITFLGLADLFNWEFIPEIYSFTLTTICYMVYGLMGMGFVFWLINRKRKKESTGLKILAVAVCFLFSWLSYLLVFVGLADAYMDLRRFMAFNGGDHR
ncbi:MAG: DUF2232 domain-containing protein [Eubacterium sp.]|nr:DUF2232 domain-containing protein [Eubacterium sp.]